MIKPARNPIPDYSVDAETRLNALEDALYSIASAMESLQNIADFVDAFDTLDGLADDLEAMRPVIEAEAAADYTAEIAELTRDYYRSVI